MKDLTKKENWDEDLRYVHRSRLLIGFFIGWISGFMAYGFFVELYKQVMQ